MYSETLSGSWACLRTRRSYTGFDIVWASRYEKAQVSRRSRGGGQRAGSGSNEPEGSRARTKSRSSVEIRAERIRDHEDRIQSVHHTRLLYVRKQSHGRTQRLGQTARR